MVLAPKTNLINAEETFSQLYTRNMRALAGTADKFSWQSQFLKENSPINSERIHQIVEAVFSHPKSQAEVDQIIDHLGGPQSPTLWNLYFQRCFNSIEGLSQGYLSLLLETSSHLPKTGTLFDCGGGTGNFSTALLSLGPNRNVRLFDMTPQALHIARRTAEQFGVSPGLITEQINLNENFEPEFSAEGIVLNNVLYTLGNNAQKLQFLKRLHSVLRPGGVLVVNDPNPSLNDPKACLTHVKAVVEAASQNLSPMTEFDIALYAHVNRKVLVGQTATFFTQEELISLVHKAGFALIAPPEVRFHGADTLLVLRKVR